MDDKFCAADIELEYKLRTFKLASVTNLSMHAQNVAIVRFFSIQFKPQTEQSCFTLRKLCVDLTTRTVLLFLILNFTFLTG